MARKMGIRRGAHRRLAARVEGLESRQLLAVVFNEFPVPNTPGLNVPSAITVGPDGNIWFLQSEIQQSRQGQYKLPFVGVFDTKTDIVIKIPLPQQNLYPGPIAVGPDGNLWVTEPSLGQVGVINPTTRALTQISNPPGVVAQGIVAGPDGNLWFTDTANGAVGTINPTTHAFREYPLAKSSSAPQSITVGPDGDLWFTEFGAGKVGTINPTTKVIAEFSLPTPTNQPGQIVSGPGGDLWFLDQDAAGHFAYLGRIDPATHAITETLENSTAALTPGPDGNIWFLQGNAPTTDQVSLSEYDVATDAVSINPIPGSSTSFQGPGGVVAAPDGTFWVNDSGRLEHGTIIPADRAVIQAAVFSDPSTARTFSGGPLAGRTVFLDADGNGAPDPGEPTAVTGANGLATFASVAPGTYTPRLLTYPAEAVDTLSTSGQPITIGGGQYYAVPTFGVVPVGSVLPLNFSTSPFGASNPDVSTAEVVGLYRTLFNRAPDPAGLASSVAFLKGGGSLQVLTQILEKTGEYQSDVIASYYTDFLHRAGSPTEIAAWAALLKAGMTEEQVAQLFVTSTGFNSLFPTDAGYIEALFEDFLGRRASASEIAAWDAYLKITNRAAVAHLLINGDPAMRRAVDGFAATFWGQALDEATEDFDVNYLLRGGTLADLAAAFAASPPYRQRANATVG